MIVKMKTQQASPLTTKLEGMVNDFTVGSYQLSLFNSFSFFVLGKDIDQTWTAHLNKLRAANLLANRTRMDFFSSAHSRILALTKATRPAIIP